jgi:hypothetical protein
MKYNALASSMAGFALLGLAKQHDSAKIVNEAVEFERVAGRGISGYSVKPSGSTPRQMRGRSRQR